MYQSMTEHENLKMEYGEFVFSTLSSERQEALFEDFQIAFSREVKLDTNLTEIRDTNGHWIYGFSNTSLPSKYATPEEKDARFEVFKATLKEIDDMNAHSRSINGRTVFGISCASDVPSARFDHDRGDAVQRGHDEEEPIKIEGVPVDEAVQTDITSLSPVTNSTTAPLKYSISSLPDAHTRWPTLPDIWKPQESMRKYDFIYANIPDNWTMYLYSS